MVLTWHLQQSYTTVDVQYHQAHVESLERLVCEKRFGILTPLSQQFLPSSLQCIQ